MSSVIQRSFTSNSHAGNLPIADEIYDYINPYALYPYSLDDLKTLPYSFFVDPDGPHVKGLRYKFALYGLFNFYQGVNFTYLTSDQISPPDFAMDPGALYYDVIKYIAALYGIFQDKIDRQSVGLLGNQDIEKWIDFIESLDLPMIRVIEDPDNFLYSTPLLHQTAAYWAHYLNGMDKKFTAKFHNFRYFWKIISDEDPYWTQSNFPYPYGSALTWPQYNDAIYGTYLNSVDFDDDLRIIDTDTYEESVNFFSSLSSEQNHIYSKKYTGRSRDYDAFLNLPNRTSYFWLHRHTQVEPFNFGKLADEREIFTEYAWEEPFVNKNFYILIQIRSNGYGGLETVLTKKYKDDFVDTNNNNNNNNNQENNDADIYSIKPIYGSSVSFSSRLNYLQTSDNSLKLSPSSENNLVNKFNFKYLLKNNVLSFLLKKIENAEGYKNLEFSDPSNMYKNVIGVVEGYNINKLNNNINELDISISSYFKAPIFNWKTSSFLNLPESLEYSSSKNYKKYEFVYFDPKVYNPTIDGEKNKLDNFWFAKEDIAASSDQKFDTSKWTKTFNHDSKLPFNLNNKYDFYQLDYKNSFIQNIKYKENANSLKKFEFKIENITDIQCRSILFFFEKKCGYRRFFYKFPFMFSGYMAFICTEWNHVFKYHDCHDINATFVEDPTIYSNFFKFIDYDFYALNKIVNPYPQLLTSL